MLLTTLLYYTFSIEMTYDMITFAMYQAGCTEGN